MQSISTPEFLAAHKLRGSGKNVIKNKNKEQLIADYKLLFATKAFRTEGGLISVQPGDDRSKEGKTKDAADPNAQKSKKLDAKAPDAPKYTKRIIKNGDKTRFPQKGDAVECYYSGKLEHNGKVFDSNMELDKHGKKPAPLKFRVGIGKVIRGWDEALFTMSLGEVAELVIQPEWAYGKKGVEGKVPSGAVLVFQVELFAIG